MLLGGIMMMRMKLSGGFPTWIFWFFWIHFTPTGTANHWKSMVLMALQNSVFAVLVDKNLYPALSPHPASASCMLTGTAKTGFESAIKTIDVQWFAVPVGVRWIQKKTKISKKKSMLQNLPTATSGGRRRTSSRRAANWKHWILIINLAVVRW